MGTSIKKLCKNSRRKVSRWCSLLFLSITLSIPNNIIAQEDSAAAAQEAPGPSLENMKKTGSAMTVEVKKLTEERLARQAREEILNYVYMVLGFGLVIFVAWYTTVKAKKRREKQEETKRKFLENKIASQGGKIVHRDPHRRHGHRR